MDGSQPLERQRSRQLAARRQSTYDIQPRERCGRDRSTRCHEPLSARRLDAAPQLLDRPRQRGHVLDHLRHRCSSSHINHFASLARWGARSSLFRNQPPLRLTPCQCGACRRIPQGCEVMVRDRPEGHRRNGNPRSSRRRQCHRQRRAASQRRGWRQLVEKVYVPHRGHGPRLPVS